MTETCIFTATLILIIPKTFHKTVNYSKTFDRSLFLNHPPLPPLKYTGVRLTSGAGYRSSRTTKAGGRVATYNNRGLEIGSNHRQAIVMKYFSLLGNCIE